MAPIPILLLLGAGSNIGLNVTRAFSQHGYKVALAARSPSDDLSGSADLTIKADLSDTTAVTEVFKEVISKLGHPNVVIYNAAVVRSSPANDPFAQDVSEVRVNLGVNFFSAYVAAQQAVESFKATPSDLKKTFMFTGNGLNAMTFPGLLAFGAGKSASAHMIANASKAYTEKAFRFYYVDERNTDGSAVGRKLSGKAHAKEFWELAERNDQGPWDWTFAAEKGYVDFGGK